MAHPGKCSEICAGIAGIGCPEGETCMLPPQSCEIVDAQGLCVPAPGACPEVFMPVCGCDGATYGNQCELIRAGVALDHRGHCGPGHMHAAE
ncbi:MAG: hypothetical protein HY899_16145 [Deltaproteobacteria bacterium]|nr:hypothetical protein [Deltaproteobacteria bacterium]